MLCARAGALQQTLMRLRCIHDSLPAWIRFCVVQVGSKGDALPPMPPNSASHHDSPGDLRRLGEIEQRYAKLQRDRLLKIERQISSSISQGRTSWQPALQAQVRPQGSCWGTGSRVDREGKSAGGKGQHT
jgi:hypothetical protein